MDYRINNEAIVGCVIAQVVKHGPYEVPFVTGMVNLLMQDKLRRKVLATPGDRVQELGMLFGQLDGELLGVIMNSMTMLIEGRCLKRHDDTLTLTGTGIELCEEMNNGKSKLLAKILRDLDNVLFKYDGIDKNALYEQMWIAYGVLHQEDKAVVQ